MSELKREQYGNTSTEQGSFERGDDFEGINHSTLPESRPDPVEVDAQYVPGDGITLTPKKVDSGEFRQALGDLKEGPMDQLMGQLCENPEEENGLTVQKIHGIEVQGNAARLAEISKRSPREMLVYYGMHPEYDGAVAGDRIMLLRDIKESAYSCKACKGTGYEEDALCGNCGGTGKETIKSEGGEMVSVPCRACRVLGYGHEGGYSSGHKKCSKCNGSGWRGGIIIPEESQKEAITGIVVSLGPDTKIYKIGDRLMFSRFAGHTMEISKTTSFIIMREDEAIGILRQKGDWR
jgi:co-chaperonin GroES (HSP10)